MDFDRAPLARVMSLIDLARQEGAWLVLAGHDVGDEGPQTVLAPVLDALCAHCAAPANGIWIDRLDRMGEYTRQARS